MRTNDQKIISNAWISTVEENKVLPIFGDLIVENGTIAKIRKRDYSYFLNHPHLVNKDSFNAGGRLLTVPLVNFHDHFYSRLAKGFSIKGEMNNFINILHNYWWKVDKLLDEKMIRASVKLAALESIKNGVLYIFDHHSSPINSLGSLKVISDVLAEFNLRGTVCFETSDRNGAEYAAGGLKENRDSLFSAVNSDVKPMLGLHASFTLSDDTLAEAADLVEEFDLGIHIHLSEDEIDNKLSVEIANLRPLERLNLFNLINVKSILAHGIHLKDSDYSILQKSGGAIAYNFDSNFNNGVGLPSLIDLPEFVPVLFGTDGMHANPAKSMKQYFLLLRHQSAAFDEAFQRLQKSYFDQFVFVKRYFSDFSTLHEGENAEFIIWDYFPAAPLNSENFLSHYIYGTVENRVHSCFRNNKFLMKEFHISDIDETMISSEIADQGKRLKELFEK